MGFRRLTFLLSVAYALTFAACGDDGGGVVFEDARTDTGSGDPIDAAVDAPPDALQCTSPATNCSGTCVNTNTDVANCGACGTACDSGDVCSGGLCCNTGEQACGGACVNVNSDAANCGTCGNACGSGETCQNGTCCGGSNTACGNQCFDLQTDPMHCGDCNTACGNTETCSAGMCCPGGQINCGGTCIDPDTNNMNCGACSPANGGTGAVCNTAGGQSCDDGICCGTGTENCGGACVDTDTSNAHCGACGATCASGNCNNGVCCPSGQISCNGTTCIDPLSDNTNCGGCPGAGGDTCVQGELCDGGECCGPGTQNCGGACVDVLDDNANCGGCGMACGANEVCSGGTCVGGCAIGEENCNGDCANLTNDHQNCGACGTACDPDEVCSGSACVPLTTGCGSLTNCGGSCVDLQNDPTHCGNCQTDCAAGQVCSTGLCCPAGQTNTGGICCPTGFLNCNGVCADPNDEATCGTCNTNCGSGTCYAGSPMAICCPAGQERCGNTCVDTDTSMSNCGACGATCSGTGAVCDDGVCCTGGTENCGGLCVNKDNDESNCGACGNDCPNATDTCSNGLCCPQGQVFTQEDGQTDPNVGICCPTGWNNCGGVCTNPETDTANCGGCGIGCGNGEFCNFGSCDATCDPPNNTTCGFCTNTNTDPDACGPSCADCPSGSSCVNGACAACPAGTPTTCGAVNGQGGTCVNIGTNSGTCGSCNTMCGGVDHCSTSTITIAPANTGATTTTTGGVTTATITTTLEHGFVMGQLVIVSGVGVAGYNGTWTVTAVPSTTQFRFTVASALTNSGGGSASSGECCGPGLDACPGADGTAPNTQCVDRNNDENNCGACGNVCAQGSVCNNGSCECPYGTELCSGVCVVTANNPDNCGSCGTTCDSAVGGSNKPYCVSGGCTGSCPAPLVGCAIAGQAGNFECTNTRSDDDNCGACGNKCANGLGCVGGQCVQRLVPVQTPAKCIGGGPPIIVDDGNETECTGNIGAVSFRFGLCTLVGLPSAAGAPTQEFGIGPQSRAMLVDAFDSSAGPYSPNPTPAIYGGGIGTNASTQNSALTTIGGDFWVWGATGMQTKGDIVVKQRLYVRKSLDVTKTTLVQGLGLANAATDVAYIAQGPSNAITTSNNALLDIDGTLTTSDCTLPNNVTENALNCLTAPAFQMAPPCDTTADRVPVVEYVENAKLNNDNALIGINSQSLNGGSNPTRLDLPCGKYYFDTINPGKETVIYVRGRTAIFVGGSVRLSQSLTFDLEPTATVDIFVAGVVNVSNEVTLGSPAYPRLTRLYIGSPSCLGSGTCSKDSQCCSGVCSNGICTAGGGNLAQAMSLSQGGNFNGLIYAGYGQFTHQSPLEMYGSIFANTFSSSGETTIHYDKGAVNLGEECPEDPPNQACESCRDCGNQACVNNQCGACTADSQCCPPLHCDNGTCKL